MIGDQNEVKGDKDDVKDKDEGLQWDMQQEITRDEDNDKR